MAGFYMSNIKILRESPSITFQDIWDIHREYAAWGGALVFSPKWLMGVHSFV